MQRQAARQRGRERAAVANAIFSMKVVKHDHLASLGFQATNPYDVVPSFCLFISSDLRLTAHANVGPPPFPLRLLAPYCPAAQKISQDREENVRNVASCTL